MELDNVDSAVFESRMEYEGGADLKGSMEDDDDDELFKNLPTQTNQNASVHRAYGSTQLHHNYMYQTLVFHQPITVDKKICTEIIRERRTEETVQHMTVAEMVRTTPQAIHGLADIFQYEIASIIDFKEQVEFESNCEWLDCRLEIHRIINDESVTLEQLLSQLRSSFICVSNDLMIFYHTNSDFALQLSRLESYNLLILLKDPRLKSVVDCLPDEFSQYLILVVKDGKTLEDNGKGLGITIPTLAETIMNNYAMMDPKQPSLKVRFHSAPKVVFYSFFAPAHIVMPGSHINSILDKKIIALQRKYFCKVIIDGPFSRSTSVKTKHDFFRVDIFFDFQFNYWLIVKTELIKWMNSFVRAMFQCYIDKVCVSYVTHDFFCCDEVQNLMRRQHLLREVDPTFVKLIKWAKLNQVDRSLL